MAVAGTDSPVVGGLHRLPCKVYPVAHEYVLMALTIELDVVEHVEPESVAPLGHEYVAVAGVEADVELQVLLEEFKV